MHDVAAFPQGFEQMTGLKQIAGDDIDAASKLGGQPALQSRVIFPGWTDQSCDGIAAFQQRRGDVAANESRCPGEKHCVLLRVHPSMLIRLALTETRTYVLIWTEGRNRGKVCRPRDPRQERHQSRSGDAVQLERQPLPRVPSRL